MLQKEKAERDRQLQSKVGVKKTEYGRMGVTEREGDTQGKVEEKGWKGGSRGEVRKGEVEVSGE